MGGKGKNYGEIYFSRLLINNYATGVEVGGQAAEELHWWNLVHRHPVHPCSSLPVIIAHQGEEVCYEGVCV